MAAKWVPISGEFLCPGKIVLTADEKGIVISRGKRGLATTEWPSETVRLCELVEEEEALQLVTEQIEDLKYVLELAQQWCSKYHTHYYGNQRVEECSEFETMREVIKQLESIKKESTE